MSKVMRRMQILGPLPRRHVPLHPSCSFWVRQPDRCSLVSTCLRAADADIVIGPTTPVKEAICEACKLLNRCPGEAEQELMRRLASNWYTTAGHISEMTVEEAMALQLPLRLKQAVDEVVAAHPQAPQQPSGSAPQANGAAGTHDANGRSESGLNDASVLPVAAEDGTLVGQEEQDGLLSMSALQATAIAAGEPPEDLDPDIMRRCAPRFTKGHGRPPKVGTEVHSVPGTAAQPTRIITSTSSQRRGTKNGCCCFEMDRRRQISKNYA